MPNLVFAEVMGLIAIYFGIFGEMRPRGKYPKPLRLIAKVLFLVVGAQFIWQSVSELRQRDAGFATAIVAMSITVAVLLTLELTHWVKYKSAGSWPTKEATVESVDVREVHTRHNHYYVAEVAYSYTVDGEYFSGRFTRDFADEAPAWEYAKRAQGRKAAVQHHPSHPERSRLDAAPLTQLIE